MTEREEILKKIKKALQGNWKNKNKLKRINWKEKESVSYRLSNTPKRRNYKWRRSRKIYSTLISNKNLEDRIEEEISSKKLLIKIFKIKLILCSKN